MRSDVRLELASLLGDLFEGIEVDLVIEVAGVGHDRARTHLCEVGLINHVDVSGRGDEDVAFGGSVGHRHDAEAVHHRFERSQGIDFGHDDMRSHAVGPGGDATAAPTVARYDDGLPGEEDVGGADNSIQRTLSRAVAIVEEVLGGGVVDGHNRVGQRAVGRHRAEPDHARRCLFAAADHGVERVAAVCMQCGDEVGARRRW